MIDSGATPCCLARRCLNASPQLRCLPRKIYTGPGVIDANGKPMSPEFTINATLVLGHPEIRVDVDFLVFDGLPYSCIIGQSLLRKFTSWAICNNTHTLTIDCKSKLEFTDSPCSNQTLSLLTTQKITLNPGQIAEVPTRATGNILNAFRPLTDLTVLADGYNAVTQRLHVEVLPSLLSVAHSDYCTQIFVHNSSDQRRTMGKGHALRMALLALTWC